MLFSRGKRLIFLLSVTFCLSVVGVSVRGIDDEYMVVETAERFFNALHEGRYGEAWDLLTPKSQEIIVERVYKALQKAGISLSQEEVRRDFEARGDLFHAYWREFTKAFKPELVLEQCRWEIKGIKRKKEANLLLNCKVARPLKLFHLEGGWRVAFEESF